MHCPKTQRECLIPACTTSGKMCDHLNGLPVPVPLSPVSVSFHGVELAKDEDLRSLMKRVSELEFELQKLKRKK